MAHLIGSLFMSFVILCCVLIMIGLPVLILPTIGAYMLFGVVSVASFTIWVYIACDMVHHYKTGFNI